MSIQPGSIGDTLAIEGSEKKGFESIYRSGAVKKIIIQITYFFMGVLASREAVFGGYAPFGAALAAAVPLKNLISVTSGAILGCLFPFAINNSIRYLAALLAVSAIRWTLSDFKIVREHPLFAPVVAMVPLLATGFSLGFVNSEIDSAFIVMCLTESLLAAAASYFFVNALGIIDSGRGITTLNQQELACGALTICIAFLAFWDINIGYISLGRVLAVLAILLCAYYGSVAGGCIAGVATGAVLSLASPGVNYISGAYAFGGLMSGLFSPVGRVGTAAAFILSNAIVALQTGKSEIVIASIYEIMIATTVFMFLPKSWGSKLKQIFDSAHGFIESDSIKRNIIMKMDFASKTLLGVSDCVDEVFKKLKKLNIKDINDVYSKTCDSICKRCGVKRLCWEEEYDNTIKTFNERNTVLREKGKITPEDFPESFSRRCSKITELTKTLNSYYSSYITSASVQRRVNEVRSVVYDQFCGMSEILGDMSSELQMYDKYDSSTEESFYKFFRDLNIPIIDISCRIDKLNRMSVEIEAGKISGNRLLKKEVLRQIDKICDRKMDRPLITSSRDISRIQISERPLYSMSIGVKQHVCNNGALCGDSFSYFNDGLGRMVFIISDGMGTGGRAAVDGAMASGIMTKLAKAGISFDCALRIVNSALLVKSSEESLATLDIVRMDMFSGKIEFMKAGAPLTLIRKGGKVIRVDAPSLPVGILTEVSFAKEISELEPGDRILMLSDGVTACGDRWLEKELERWGDDSEKEFSSRIVKQAQFRRTDGRDDDITAIAIKIAG